VKLWLKLGERQEYFCEFYWEDRHMAPRKIASLLAILIWSSTVYGQSPNRVQMLIENLSDTDPGIRMQAAHSLAALGEDSGPAIPALIAVLDDKEPDVRYQAVIALGKAGSSSTAINALVIEINDTSKDVRYEAISALGTIGKPAGIAVGPLLKCLDSPDNVLVSNAGAALQKIEPHASSVMPTVMRLMREGSYTQKIAALNAARGADGGPDSGDNDKTGTRVFDAIVGLLDDKSPTIRQEALETLQSMWIPKTATRQQLNAILSTLHDPEEDIRLAAVKVLRHTNDEDLLLAPLPLLSDPSLSVREAVIDVVGSGENVRSIPGILATFDDPSSAVRADAITRLESTKIGRSEICLATAKATKDRFVAVRVAATNALGNCTEAEAHTALAIASRDAQPPVRIAAMTSIAKARNHGWQSQDDRDANDTQLFDAVIHRLDDPEDQVRTAAATTLQSLVPLPESYLEGIAPHLKDSSAAVRAVAARIVGTYGSHAIKVAPQLRELLRDEKEVRVAAAESLGLVGASDTDTIAAFAQVLETPSFLDDNGSFTEAILLSLGRIGPASRPALDGVVEVVAEKPGDYDQVEAGMRSLREMGPDARVALTQLLSRTPPQPPADAPVTLVNLSTVYRPAIQKLIARYDDEIKVAPVHLKTGEGKDIDLQAGGRNLVIVIGTWCPHSRLLIDFLSNPQVRSLTSGWTFNFVLLDEKPEIDALGGVAVPENDASASTFDKNKYPSLVPLYDVSILARLPGNYYFYSPSEKDGRIGLPSVFDPVKGKFHGSTSALITRELGIPNWIETSLKY
jgi:HEAT repeat protein